MESDTESISEAEEWPVVLAQAGEFAELQSIWNALPNPEDHINRLYDGKHPIRRTLLAIACLNEHEDFVRQFLLHYRPDLEVLNVVEIEDSSRKRTIFFGVSALWVAASVGNFEIVKLLVEHGAQVNQVTATNSTALRCACRNGNLDMVRYLVENGGDIRIAAEQNDTNLLRSIANRHLNVVTYLVDEKGFDVNECDTRGRSPLYMAARSGSLEITQFLLHRGARHFPSNHNQMSPLMWAAEKRRTDVFNAILPHCSMLELIRGKELFGSSLVCDRFDNGDLELPFKCFSRALDLRAQHDLPKAPRPTTIELFGNRQECGTSAQLQAIRLNADEMWNEAMLVRERLLGPKNENFLDSMRCHGALLAERGGYDRTLALWFYELQLRREHGLPIDRETSWRFARMFRRMLLVNSFPSIDIVETVIAVTLKNLVSDSEDFDDQLYSLLSLITIASQVLDSRVNLWFHLFFFHRSWPSQASRMQIEERSMGNSVRLINNNWLSMRVDPLSCTSV